MFVLICKQCGDGLEMPFRGEELRAFWIEAHSAGPDPWGKTHHEYTLFESDGHGEPRHNERQFVVGQ